MPPKPAQDKVNGLRRDGLSESEIRLVLKRDGYKKSRISQLLTLTRATLAPEAQPNNQKRNQKKNCDGCINCQTMALQATT